jgi:predicted GTPase
MEEATDALNGAIRALEHAVSHPTLVVATTGTTSGGKSAIVNYLCGAQLMPVAVQEMSAGTVTLEHCLGDRTVLITPTAGAVWETGEFPVATPEDVRQRLEPVMNAYREHRQTGLDPPLFRVRFPLRIGTQADRCGLPDGSRIVVLDLPGLNYVGDKSNGDVIRELCRQALCLVTINSEATDPKARAALVQQVVEEVRKLRGSPARMLFIANRFDVFQRDKCPDEQSRKFVDSLQRDIRQRVAEVLPEWREEAAKLAVIPFSSEPALYGLQVAEGTEDEQAAALERLDRFYSFLVPDHIRDLLPRVVSKATSEQRRSVALAVAQTSYGTQFREAFERHVACNLPMLLLPQHLAKIRDALVHPLTAVDSEVNARIASARNRCDEEIARIEAAANGLQALRDRIRQQLEPLSSHQKGSGGTARERLAQAATEVAKRTKVGDDVLAPLMRWIGALEAAADALLDEVRRALCGEDLKGPSVRGLPTGTRNQLSVACEALSQCGYSADFARKGGRITRTGSGAKDQLRQIRSALRNLGRAVVPAIKAILQERCSIEAESICSALERLFAHQNRALIQEAARLAPELRGLQLPLSTIDRIDERLSWSIEVSLDVDLTTTTRRQQTGTETVTRSKRQWYTLWIWKKEWEEEIPIYGDVEYHHLDVPSVSDLCGGIYEQFLAAKPEETFLLWLDRQLDKFHDRVRAFHEERVAEYKRRLVDAKKNAQVVHDDTVKELERLQVLFNSADTALRKLVRY